jgi:hypothetical protein
MEHRAFSIDPALLYSVIESQAGTLEKALLEGVMNSIDAASSRVTVVLTRDGFVIRDNGRGFKSRDEILNWFETFGTPHKEGDATYGKFRMGRGQLMAFAATVWRSGEFQMNVDIRNAGLGYQLSQNLEKFRGCEVVGTLYQALSEERLHEVDAAFRRLVAFAPVPVELNGQVVSVRPEKAKWSYEDETCWLKLDPDARELLIYNQGVLVKGMPGWRFGSGGVAVSKASLQVNFARNDIMEYDCSQWALMRTAIERGVLERLSSRKQLSDDQRAFLARKVLASRTGLGALETSAKIFTDIQGKHVTLADVMAAKTIAFECPSRLQLSRVLHDTGEALVLSRKSLDRVGLGTPKEFFERLEAIPDFPSHRLRALDIEALPSRMAGPKDRELTRDALRKRELAALLALEVANKDLAAWLIHRGVAESIRELRVGVRAGAVAWTDGKEYVYAHRKALSHLDRGLDGAWYWVSTLLHEYCHDTDDSESHDHGEVFYAKYHELTGAPDAPLVRIAMRLQKAFVDALRAQGYSASHLLTRQLKGSLD